MGDEILPTVDYPPMIRGSLRLMLQLKDAFLGSFNLVEEYRDQLLACKHGFTRDLVVYQLTKGLASITRLREDLAYVESQAQGRLKRNTALREYILDRYGMSTPSDKTGASAGIVTRIGQDQQPDPNRSGTGTAVLGNSLPPPINAPDSVEQALHGGLDRFKGTIDVDVLQVPEEIDLATTTTESGTHLLPVVEFYRGFFFLQMHFQLIMCQAANYAMPVVTRPMSLAERAFSWPTMPSFGLASTTGALKDRLLDIHTDVVALATRLHECLALVREKMLQDRKIESYFMQHTAAQEALRRNLLRCLQAQRVYIECLEAQNDRLAGLAIKLDPSFAKSSDFALMTGPGVTFQDTSKTDVLASNQNSAAVSPKFQNRKPAHDKHSDRDPNNRKDDDGRNGGFGLLHRQSNEYSYSGYDQQRAQSPRQESSGTHKSNTQEQQDSQFTVGNRKNSERYSSSDRSPALNSNLDVQPADVNFSASGGGHPAVWIQHGRMTSRVPTESTQHLEHKHVDVDMEITRKLDSMKGNSMAVQELLIGLDSVASGGGARLGVANENMPTPSFLNTEHYVTSIYDDVFGQTTNDPAGKSSATHKQPTYAATSTPIATANPSLHTPSTRFSQAEPISPTISVEQSAVTVFSPRTSGTPEHSSSASFLNGSMNGTNCDVGHTPHIDRKRLRDGHHRLDESGVNLFSEVNPEVPGELDQTDDTFTAMSPRLKRFSRHSQQPQVQPPYLQDQHSLPRQLDTNVNASNLVLPRITPKIRQPLPRVSRAARSGHISTIMHAKPVRMEDRKELYRCPTQNECIDQYTSREAQKEALAQFDACAFGRAADSVKLQQVPTVGSTECGQLCVPEWVARRATTYSHKSEDLLEEPKRTAFNKAVLAHRCRLVETILQADEERLEEIISLLMKD
ncbi:hypothetical protein EG68_08057 [Paragonimus skrjabini miyazakii]|uniref:DUF5743 domain-containing protein n=1 Tax=Paragonimus skrjabini miyazakii TaxID=59628 RepID=A0A8S9YC95_9TREM|nr:hypothetical protein EG68_08057 [Paragonimus skrjabini miyazakii]